MARALGSPKARLRYVGIVVGKDCCCICFPVFVQCIAMLNQH